MEKLNLVVHFNKVETTIEHNAYTHIAILLSVVGVFAKTLRVLRLRAANPPTMNWKIAIA